MRRIRKTHQAHVVDHTSGSEMKEERSVIKESSRDDIQRCRETHVSDVIFHNQLSLDRGEF